MTNRITEKITGNTLPPVNQSSEQDNAPSWAKWAAGIFSLTRGNIAGVAMAGSGFNWEDIILNFITVLGVGTIITAITDIILGPISLALLGLGVGVVQADQARKQLVKITTKELTKHLPQMAQDYSPKISETVKECFDTYEQQITERMNDDIQSRKAELHNLVKQQESHDINQEKELERLQKLQQDVKGEAQWIQSIYNNFLKTAS